MNTAQINTLSQFVNRAHLQGDINVRRSILKMAMGILKQDGPAQDIHDESRRQAEIKHVTKRIEDLKFLESSAA
jgi:hypothetical protein